MKLSAVIFSASLALSSGAVLASGGGSYGGGSYGGDTYQQRKVDETYEVGKAIYNGRQSGYPKLSYCVVASEGEKVPLKSKSIKQYKRTSYNELSQNLYNCDNPDSLISSELSQDAMLHVLYYLNKRYRLSLRGS